MNELPYDDICEAKVVLFYVRDLLAEANHGGLAAGEFSLKEVGRRRALQNCNGVLTEDGHLADCFRVVLLSVLAGREVGELTSEDCGKIASRHGEWLTSPLNSVWRELAYHSRQK